jgi:hypothetical protein
MSIGDEKLYNRVGQDRISSRTASEVGANCSLRAYRNSLAVDSRTSPQQLSRNGWLRSYKVHSASGASGDCEGWQSTGWFWLVPERQTPTTSLCAELA